jgi:hypothetical protein
MNSDLILYQSEEDAIHVNVRLKDETIWLTQPAIVDLFQSSKVNICEHIAHIYAEGELTPKATVWKFRTVQAKEKEQSLDKLERDLKKLAKAKQPVRKGGDK